VCRFITKAAGYGNQERYGHPMILNETGNQICKSNLKEQNCKSGEEIEAVKECVLNMEKKFSNCVKNYGILHESRNILFETLSDMEPDVYRNIENLRGNHSWLFCHSVDVGFISLIIAGYMNYSREDKEKLCVGALFHDIGKLNIPCEILQKPCKLSREEMAEMRRHSVLGYNIVRELNIHIESKAVVLQHHERLDGSGYPYGLHDKEISDFSKIVMVADAFDAISSCRPYRAPKTVREALEIIKKDIGKYPVEIINYLENLLV
jgi:putative nucleotidyltransferase with HDIG domain